MIVLHLDILDVIRLGQLQPGEAQPHANAREAIELFAAAVTPSLFSYVSEAPLFNVIGLLGLILDRVNVQAIARTRVGLSILTMLTSRATLVKEAGGIDESEWQQWSQFYNRLFDILEPSLGVIFPGSVNTGEDIYVWQFLAAIGSGASPEQQQRLVIAVK
jgi:DNA topoisomerase 2-associated protein PAT1